MDQDYRLARVHWKIGQALLPEHFFAQEESLRGEVHLRLGLNQVPVWGVGVLQFEPYALPTGVVTIQKMTLVLRSGMVIDIPGNAKPVTIKLSDKGEKTVRVYLHVLSLSDKPKTPVASEETKDDEDEEGIERIVHQLSLSTEPSSPSMIDSIEIARFQAAPDKVWSVDRKYLPPLACVGRSSPLFNGQRMRMRAITQALREIWLGDIGRYYLAGESQAATRQALRGLFTFEQMLGDLEHGIAFHPYEIFKQVRSLFMDVSMYAGRDPLLVDVWYVHEEFGEVLNKFLVKLEEYIQEPRNPPPYVAFTKTGTRWECALAPDARRSRDVYLLVYRPHVSTVVDISATKLASPTRIQTLHERALLGIPCKRIKNPPFHHDLSSNVDWYQLEAGEEWDYAIRDRKVVMFDSADLGGSQLFLYYRPS